MCGRLNLSDAANFVAARDFGRRGEGIDAAAESGCNDQCRDGT